MSSSEPPAAGKPTATELDDKDEALLARFLAAGAQHLFEYPSKEEASGKKGKQDKSRRRVNRDARNLSGGTLLRDAQAKLAPPPPAAAFSTHSSFGAAMPRRHGPLRRYDGSLQVRSNDPCPTSMQRASCVRDVPHNAHVACGRTRATGLTSSVVFSARCPATIEARGLTMPQSSISNRNGARSSATACKREREALRQVSLRSL